MDYKSFLNKELENLEFKKCYDKLGRRYKRISKHIRKTKFEKAHILYIQCKNIINRKYTDILELVTASDEEEEKAFYYLVSDFFMQQEQKKLLKARKNRNDE